MLPPKEKKEWRRKAEWEKLEHEEKHPGYKYQPQSKAKRAQKAAETAAMKESEKSAGPNAETTRPRKKKKTAADASMPSVAPTAAASDAYDMASITGPPIKSTRPREIATDASMASVASTAAAASDAYDAYYMAPYTGPPIKSSRPRKRKTIADDVSMAYIASTTPSAAYQSYDMAPSAGRQTKGLPLRKTTRTLSADASMASVAPTMPSAASFEWYNTTSPFYAGPLPMRSPSTAPSSLLPTPPPPAGNHPVDYAIHQQTLPSDNDREAADREDPLRYERYLLHRLHTMGKSSGLEAKNGILYHLGSTGAAAHADNGGLSTAGAFDGLNGQGVVHNAGNAVIAPDWFGPNTELPDARTGVSEWRNSVGEASSTHDVPSLDNGSAQPSVFEQNPAYGTGSAAGNGYDMSTGFPQSCECEAGDYQYYSHAPSDNLSSRSTSIPDMTAASRTHDTGYASYGPEYASTSGSSNASFVSQGTDYNGTHGYGTGAGLGADFGAESGFRPSSKLDFNCDDGVIVEDWESEYVNPLAPTLSPAQWQGEGPGAHGAL
ncbi:hypothetical protein BD626DRAFT_583349 [Schizophyllum amplum]|uniref:HMG box domain-containing protein n=1 Tax=Schizophyllum amplum TaxID=97359 RepID=A0A550CEY4_9AGAR|nr:hypothetical protein BD626DRAFT_583349 [Auriculariopsis ampla]